jgi:hypothetical protein
VLVMQSGWASRLVQRLSLPQLWSPAWALRLLLPVEPLPFRVWRGRQGRLARLRARQGLLPLELEVQLARQQEEQFSGVAVLLRL